MESEPVSASSSAVSAFHLEELCVPFGAITSTIVRAGIRTDKLVKLASASADAPVDIATLVGAWNSRRAASARLEIAGDHLRSIVKIGSSLVAFEFMAQDERPAKHFARIVSALGILDGAHGNKPDEVYFAGAHALPALQALMNPADGEFHMLWHPGRWGVTSVRYHRYWDLLIGVLCDVRGRGRKLVSCDRRTALRNPAALADLTPWKGLTPTETRGLDILSLSRLETDPASASFYLNYQERSGPRRFCQRSWLKRDMSGRLSMLSDDPFETAYLMIGSPHAIPDVLAGYAPCGRSARGGFHVSFRAEPRSAGSRPFSAASALPPRSS